MSGTDALVAARKVVAELLTRGEVGLADDLEAALAELRERADEALPALRDAEDYAVRAASRNLDRARMPLTQRAWMDAIQRAEGFIAEAKQAAAFEKEHGGCECRTCLVAAGEEDGR